MGHYVGMDVGKERTAVCIIDRFGEPILEREVETDPEAIMNLLAPSRSAIELAGLEGGGMSSWLTRCLRKERLPVVQVDAGRLHRYASASPAKTDRHDARVIAEALRGGLYREVFLKSVASHELWTLLAQRAMLLQEARRLEVSVRGTLRSGGRRMQGRGGIHFRDRVTAFLEDERDFLDLLTPTLDARDTLLAHYNDLNSRTLKAPSQSPTAQLFMGIPGVGAITALTFIAAIDEPRRFHTASQLGSYIGLVPRVYQTGESLRVGGITKRGNFYLRKTLFQAAMVHLTRCKQSTLIQEWGLRVAARRGRKRAIIGCARKLAIVMHRMWITGEEYRAT
jgi:transposase